MRVERPHPSIASIGLDWVSGVGFMCFFCQGGVASLPAMVSPGIYSTVLALLGSESSISTIASFFIPAVHNETIGGWQNEQTVAPQFGLDKC
jgi:hypothetical protein